MKTLGQKIFEAQKHRCQMVIFSPVQDQMYCGNRAITKYKNKWLCSNCYRGVMAQAEKMNLRLNGNGI